MLVKLFKENEIEISTDKIKILESIAEDFYKWNQKVSLSSFKDKESILTEHILDSLFLTKFLDISNKKIIDLGVGGGFPSLALSVLTKKPITAVDSVLKKINIIKKIADKNNLKLNLINNRIETLAHKKNLRESFDLVCARALAKWPTLLEYTIPFIKKGAFFVAYQGPQIKEDLVKFKGLEEIFGAKIFKIFSYKINNKERNLVLIKKIKETPQKFPRSVGIPKKQPLSIFFDEKI